MQIKIALQPSPPSPAVWGLWICSLLALLLIPASGTTAEPRQRLDADSPQFLQSVGRLLVPGRRIEDGRERHYRESCSATLLTPSEGMQASLILTAWHCLEYHTDLTDDIVFIIESSSGQHLRRSAKALSSGGGMHADWSIMRLREPIPTDRVSTASLSRTAGDDIGSRVVMAGFSRDETLGDSGKVLTFHRDCQVLAQSDRDMATDCLAYRGASGGGVFSSDGGRLLGVISRGDGRENSIFVPASRIAGTARVRSLLR